MTLSENLLSQLLAYTGLETGTSAGRVNFVGFIISIVL